MDLDTAIKSRRSVKKFSSKKANWKHIIECIDSMRYAPTAGKNFVLKFIVVSEKEKLKKIAKLSDQDFIATVEYIVIVYSDPSRTKNLFGERGEIYTRQQAGAAIQNFLLKIIEKGLSTCWIGHFDEEKLKKEFKIPDGMNVEALFPVGYEEKKEKPSRKISLDNVLYFEEHKKKQMKKIRKINI